LFVKCALNKFVNVTVLIKSIQLGLDVIAEIEIGPVSKLALQGIA